MRPTYRNTIRLLAATAVTCFVTSASAVITAPYVPDASTLHLWHLNETAAPAIDSVPSGGTNLTALANGATLGNASFPGLGTSLSTYDGGQGGTNLATAIDGYLAPIALANGAGDNVPIVVADPVTKAFTFEAVIWIGFDPAQNFGPVAGGGNGRNQPMQIISGEQDSTGGGVRVFQWRMDPIGFVAGASDVNTVRMEFINVNNGTLAQNMFAYLPTTGSHAILSNHWYHVAVSYNGQAGTPDNLKLYWTTMDASLTSANEVLSTNMALSLPTGAMDFCVGNIGRGTPNGNFIGSIDEVRISSVGRSAQGMMFAPANVQIDTQPKGQIVAAGDTVNLVSAASGGGPISYQWQLYSTNLPTATNNTLVISNITTAQSGPYRLIASNSVNTATSTVANVSVGALVPELFPTGLDDNGTRLPGGYADPHYSLTYSEDPSYPGPALYVSSALPGAWLANSASSKWIAPGDGANLLGGNYIYRTIFLLDSGDTNSVQLNGNVVADNQLMDVLVNGTSTELTNSGALNTFFSFVLTNGFVPGLNTLDFLVTNYPGTGANLSGFRAELRAAALPLVSVAPQITTAPVNVSTQSQQSVMFTVAASGSPTLAYQWYHDTTLLSGKTDRKLTLSNLIPADAGTYTVYVTNSFGSTNVSATLTVTTPPALAWTGKNGGDWDTLTQNWLNLGTSADTTFSPLTDVLLDDRGAAQPTLNLVEQIKPNSITFDASSDYTFTSYALNGWLSGSFPLVKKNSGKLILSVTNLSTGPVTVAGGVLQVGNSDTAATLGQGSVSISNNAALVFARGDNITVRNPISGAGAVTNAQGTTYLVASNSYTGPTVVLQGSLVARNPAALGAATAGTSVEQYAQLMLDTAIDLIAEPLTINGTGPASDGALRKGGSSASTIGGPITLAGDAMIKVDGSSTLTLSNTVNATGKNLTLWSDGGGTGVAAGQLTLGAGVFTKDGAGTWQLVNNGNTGSGGTVINAGTLQLGTAVADGSLPAGTVTDNGTLAFYGTNDLAFGNLITGTGTVTKNTPNTVTLSAANDYTGATGVGASGGTLLIGNDNALGTTNGNTSIAGGFAAVGRVAFPGGRTVAEPFVLAGRQPTDISAVSAHLINLAGTNTLTGAISVSGGGNQYNVESAAGLLVVAGDFAQTLSSPRYLNLQGAGDAIWTGAINDGSPGVNYPVVTKRDAGRWTLAGTNNYSGQTTNANGTLVVTGSIGTNTVTVLAGATLAGTGLIPGAVTIQAGGTLAPGTAGIGTLTVSNALVLQAGSTNTVDVNAGTGAADQVAGLTSASLGGTLVVNNLGGSFSTSSAFQLFSGGPVSGTFAAIIPSTPGTDLAWNTSTLATDGTLRVGNGAAMNPTNITATVVSNGSALQLSWPTDHMGWGLQVQTNAVTVGIRTNWTLVAGSTSTNLLVLPINPANGSVFYRLVSP